MKDYHPEMEAKENSPESVETGATVNIEKTVLSKARVFDVSTQYDSEGMCLEE